MRGRGRSADGLIRVKNNPAKKATAGKRDLYYYYRREARCTLCLPGEGELLHKAGFKLKVGGGRKEDGEKKKKNAPRKTDTEF